MHGGSIDELPDLFVITGGEPLLQPNLVRFIDYLSLSGIRVQIETTGTIDVDVPRDVGAYVVCSPKLNARGLPLHISLSMLERVDCMKCVVSKTDLLYNDIPFLVLYWRDQHPDRPVYVSPMNTYLKPPVKLGVDGSLEGRSETDERISFWTPGLLDLEANRVNHEYAAELALRHRVRLTLQTHLYASLP
jgi:organic radical activating enzyme